MTHEELRDRLLDLAYGELPRRVARRVEEHAASCEACRAELARIRDTRRLMSALPDEPAPEGGERILVAAAREAARGRAPTRRPSRWLWGGAVAAASVAAVVAVSYRLLELRPGPLARDGRDALLGDSPYARAPAPGATGAPAGPSEEREAARGAQLEKAPRPSGRAPAGAVEREPAAPEPPRRKDVSRARQEAAAAPDADAAGRERDPAAGEEERAPAPTAGGAPAKSVRTPSRAAAPDAPLGAASGPPAAAAAAPADATREDTDAPRALARYAGLRDAGRLRGEIRTFADCEGETWRKVETDPSGRVVKYVREGRIGGQRLRIEHVYGEDGALSSATVRDLDAPGASVDADALGLALPRRASEAAIGAPPRCAR